MQQWRPCGICFFLPFSLFIVVVFLSIYGVSIKDDGCIAISKQVRAKISGWLNYLLSLVEAIEDSFPELPNIFQLQYFWGKIVQN